MEKGNWAEAVEQWNKHGKNYPGALNSVPFRKLRAASLVNAGNHEAAMKDLEFILQKDPKEGEDLEVLELLAQCEAAAGRTEKAAGYYEQILKKRPSHTEANLYLGRRSLEKGDLYAAGRHFQSIPVEDYPGDILEQWKEIESRFVKDALEGAEGLEGKAEGLEGKAEGLEGEKDRDEGE